jgi:hypothetical protein
MPRKTLSLFDSHADLLLKRGQFGVPSMIDSLEVKVLHPA